MAGSSKTPKDAEKKDEELENSTSEAEENEGTSAEQSGESTDADGDTEVAESAGDDTPGDEISGETADEENTLEQDASEEEVSVPGVITPSTPAPAAAAPAPAPAPSGGSSTFSMVFGGLVAGAIGFLIATFVVPERPVPETAQVPDLSADLAEQAGRIDTLLEEFQAFRDAPVTPAGESTPVDLAPLTERQDQTDAAVAEVGTVLATIETSLEALNERLTAIENEPRVVSPDGSGAMEAQLEAFRAELDAVTAEAAAEIEAAKARASEIEAAAAEAAARAEREAALAELRAALESGAPYSNVLGRLPAAPEGLAAHAESGVTPLAELQQSYPNAARETLQSAESAPADGAATSRLAAFLRKQTNARSLAPREGDDTDAVLSRGEAALQAGDLSAAIGELEGLQGDVPASMSEWLDAARARQGAVDAAASLSVETTN